MWCLSRRVLSVGLRMTLQRMEDNVRQMQNLRRMVIITQLNSFSVSRSILARMNYEPAPLENEQPKCKNNPKDLVLDREQIGKVQGNLQLSFTCKRCGTRNENKIITKLAYKKGVVIIRCNGCQNNHLIADNLGWFGPDCKTRNIETILREKGENVRRIRDDSEGYFEALAQEEVTKVQRLLEEQRLAGKCEDKSA